MADRYRLPDALRRVDSPKAGPPAAIMSDRQPDLLCDADLQAVCVTTPSRPTSTSSVGGSGGEDEGCGVSLARRVLPADAHPVARMVRL
jgi:hypothetical protein